MAGADGVSCVAECFWPGVQAHHLRDLDRKIGVAVAGLAGSASGPATLVRYLGSMLIIDDEVVLLLFEGSIEAARQVLEGAGIPFERILQATGAPWRERKNITGKES
jgi:hypothetical protein